MATRVASVEQIGSYFESLPDPRHARDRKHRLTDIVAAAVCGRVCGCDGPTATHRSATDRREWLNGFLPLPDRIPSRDRTRRRLIARPPEAFQRRSRDRIADAPEPDEAGPARPIATDGKTCRRSHGAARGRGPPHVVSAWADGHGIAVGQVAAEEKSDPVTATPPCSSGSNSTTR